MQKHVFIIAIYFPLKKMWLIMPKIVFLWKERETKLYSEKDRTNWSANTGLHYCDLLLLDKKVAFDNAEYIIHRKHVEIKNLNQ